MNLKKKPKIVRTWHFAFKFKKIDTWIGVYWRKKGRDYHFWICILPCLPIEIWTTHHYEIELDFADYIGEKDESQ